MSEMICSSSENCMEPAARNNDDYHCHIHIKRSGCDKNCGSGNIKCIPYQKGETKMKQLKPITFKAIYESQEDKNCQEFWDEFMELQKSIDGWEHYDGMTLKPGFVDKYLTNHPKAKQWLTEHGFIASETYKIGDRFKYVRKNRGADYDPLHNGKDIRIITVDKHEKKIMLSYNDKEVWTREILTVKDLKKITQEEFSNLLGSDYVNDWTKICF